MRFLKGLAVGLVVIGVVGCSGAAPGSPSVGPVPAVRTTASSVPSASPQVKERARAAAAQFYGMYSVRRFAALWDLLAPATKRQIPRSAWVKVHEACTSAGAANSRTIKAVTVFGNAAIITEAVAGSRPNPGTTEDVFNYVNGHWSYLPQNLSIYHHGPVSADVAAAKAAGFCTGWKIF